MKKSRFLRVTCPRCRHPHIVFAHSSLKVKCTNCNYSLTKAQGGKAKIRALVREVLWH